ncbi:MAG: Serine/threonine-protein kinase toxin HipA [Accumulibacter sp.]|uniref:type II toxin-antitoxin system HipA family toxin n=1 Tax=Accumulibacter sp. TaxID=2053492 RepID=UPI00122798F6|nr:type II toxin-antitoxin system HipA family toxin [Accumulibacter sp.]QKS29402.1 MAG: type II toxin-antitoxin system HipA family toxin [Candidatus Accumulibacter similis]TLD46681.1 MAG: Serine/threonine-protein kinase toxin HipA [Accumulibacter sp.]
MAQHLAVWLNDSHVGQLLLTRNDGCEFRLLESYRSAYPRPVLGQQFVDDPEHVHSSRQRTPAWFSNLLPEGPLRELIARQAGVAVHREFFLLQHLGEDLPGAVRIVADDPLAQGEDAAAPEAPAIPREDHWHFSLAGVQLKFSALQAGRGLTIPVSGTGGDWIVKLPDARFPGVPENEHATMRWAQASGITIPEIHLVPVAEISGLPTAATAFAGQAALAVRRFDRPATGKRVHIEDFAQVLGLYPEQKYAQFNYETLANVVYRLAGEADLDEFIRRLVFVVAAGNGDAHLKNWSLIYPDGINARLAPAYDLVSTIAYRADDQLALNLARSKRWQDVTRESFLRLARRIGDDETRMANRLERARASILAAWHDAGDDWGYTKQARDRIASQLARVPLFAVG